MPLEVVLAVAEEREVVVGQPAQQVAGLLHLVRVDARRRSLGELVDDVVELGVHLLPVLDRLADVAEHPLDGLLQRGDVLALGDPVDLDVHPGLAGAAALADLGVPDRHRPDLLQGAGDVADDVEERVDDQVHLVQLARELHGQGVHEEGHVVDDDLDDGVPVGRPALIARSRGEHPDPGGALRALGGQPVVRGEGAPQVDVGAALEVLGRDPAVVGAQQRLDLVARWSAAALGRRGQPDRAREQGGLVRIMRRR